MLQIIYHYRIEHARAGRGLVKTVRLVFDHFQKKVFLNQNFVDSDDENDNIRAAPGHTPPSRFTLNAILSPFKYFEG